LNENDPLQDESYPVRDKNYPARDSFENEQERDIRWNIIKLLINKLKKIMPFLNRHNACGRRHF
jgi:hypothetical protein